MTCCRRTSASTSSKSTRREGNRRRFAFFLFGRTSCSSVHGQRSGETLQVTVPPEDGLSVQQREVVRKDVADYQSSPLCRDGEAAADAIVYRLQMRAATL